VYNNTCIIKLESLLSNKSCIVSNFTIQPDVDSHQSSIFALGFEGHLTEQQKLLFITSTDMIGERSRTSLIQLKFYFSWY
jgi:hypothetical protein